MTRGNHSSALSQLQTILAQAHTFPVEQDRPSVVVLGPDIPRALLRAAGVTPRRWFPVIHTQGPYSGMHEAAALFGSGACPGLVGLAAAAADDRIGAPLLIDHSTDRHVRLVQAIAWLRKRHRVEVESPVWFCDLIHGVGAASERHRATARDQLETRLSVHIFANRVYTSAPVARGGEQARRASLMSLLNHRTAAVPTLSGSRALDAIRVSESADCGKTRELLNLVQAEAAEADPVAHEHRGFVVGPAPRSYRRLEDLGVHVVGEDHDDGALVAARGNTASGNTASGNTALRSLHRSSPRQRLDAVEAAAIEVAADTLVIDSSDPATAWLTPAFTRMAERHHWRVLQHQLVVGSGVDA